MIKLKFDPDMIKAILDEKDPEGLIDMGAPYHGDEYHSEAQMIYNRLVSENIRDLGSITIKVIGVMFEMFGISSSCYDSENGDLISRNDVHFDFKYIERRLKCFESIA